MCFDSPMTDVAIVFTLFPLSFKSSITDITSLGHIGVRLACDQFNLVSMRKHYVVLVGFQNLVYWQCL